MKNSSSVLKKEVIKDLQRRISKLQSELEKRKKPRNGDGLLNFKLQKSQARFERIRRPKERDIGHGEFFLLVGVTAQTETLYVPISIASSKKPTGFVYHIEGTAEGTILRTDISCRGEGITKVTLGTLLYAKIPAGKTATFRMLIEIRGGVGKEYKIVINRINYKLDPRDARYKRLDAEISSKVLGFR